MTLISFESGFDPIGWLIPHHRDSYELYAAGRKAHSPNLPYASDLTRGLWSAPYLLVLVWLAQEVSSMQLKVFGRDLLDAVLLTRYDLEGDTVSGSSVLLTATSQHAAHVRGAGIVSGYHFVRKLCIPTPI